MTRINGNSAFGAIAIGPGLVLIVLATALIAWWQWMQGAYFGSVLLPGLIALCALLALFLAFASFPGRVGGPAFVALGALLLLAAWTALSGLWSPTSYRGPEYALRVLVYAGLFVVGLWSVLLLRGKVDIALGPVALGTALVGAGTIATLWLGSELSWYLHPDGTLRFPIGYRNANATMFLIAAWPLLAVAAAGRWTWAVRALAVAGLTLVIGLALLAQSRGSLPALAVGALVFIILSPRRVHIGLAAFLACLTLVPAFATLTDVYRFGSDEAGVAPLLESAAGSLALSTVGAFLLAAIVFGAIQPRASLGVGTQRLVGQVVGSFAVIAVLVAGSALVADGGGPVELVESRVSEFVEPASAPDFTDRGVRYGANVQSNRGDFWRVSWDAALGSPIIGQGAGSFEVDYLRERKSHESPQDPHGVFVLMGSELGLVGLILFTGFLVAAFVAAFRSRRSGIRAVALSTVAIAALAHWLTHASFDWFWQYPGLTAPVMYLLGAAAAPRLHDPSAELRRGWRLVSAGLVVLIATAAAVQFVSERYSNRAAGSISFDPPAAARDYERAARLSPLDPRPLIGQAEAHLATGDVSEGEVLLREALDREATNFRARYLLTLLLASEGDPGAWDSYRETKALNPADPSLEELRWALQMGAR